MKKLTKDMVRAMLLLLSAGDALGVPVETMTHEEIALKHGRVTDYIDPTGHAHYKDWTIGRWSDDTQLSIAITQSLAACHGMNMDDIISRHILAHDECHIGWGGSTCQSLARLKQGVHWSASGAYGNGKGEGNGVAMKVAILAAFFAQDTHKYVLNVPRVKEVIRDLTIMTHMTEMAVASAAAQVEAVHYCLMHHDDFSSEEFIEGVCQAVMIGERSRVSPKDTDQGDRLSERLSAMRHAELTVLSDAEIRARFGNGSCYVYESLPVAYALFLRNPTSIESLYDAVNFGGDTDTIASLVGALLGAFNGTAIIPEHLLKGLWRKDEILRTADKFCTAFHINDRKRRSK